MAEKTENYRYLLEVVKQRESELADLHKLHEVLEKAAVAEQTVKEAQGLTEKAKIELNKVTGDIANARETARVAMLAQERAAAERARKTDAEMATAERVANERLAKLNSDIYAKQLELNQVGADHDAAKRALEEFSSLVAEVGRLRAERDALIAKLQG